MKAKTVERILVGHPVKDESKLWMIKLEVLRQVALDREQSIRIHPSILSIFSSEGWEIVKRISWEVSMVSVVHTLETIPNLEKNSLECFNYLVSLNQFNALKAAEYILIYKTESVRIEPKHYVDLVRSYCREGYPKSGMKIFESMVKKFTRRVTTIYNVDITDVFLTVAASIKAVPIVKKLSDEDIATVSTFTQSVAHEANQAKCDRLFLVDKDEITKILVQMNEHIPMIENMMEMLE